MGRYLREFQKRIEIDSSKKGGKVLIYRGEDGSRSQAGEVSGRTEEKINVPQELRTTRLFQAREIQRARATMYSKAGEGNLLNTVRSLQHQREREEVQKRRKLLFRRGHLGGWGGIS